MTTEPLWDDNDWRAGFIATLTRGGISLARAYELLDKYVARCRDEADRDTAYDSRMGWGDD